MAERRIIDAANYMAARSLNYDEAQISLLVQGAGGFQAVEHENVQVIYTQNHWVATASDSEGMVIVANSLGDSVEEALANHAIEAAVCKLVA